MFIQAIGRPLKSPYILCVVACGVLACALLITFLSPQRVQDATTATDIPDVTNTEAFLAYLRGALQASETTLVQTKIKERFANAPYGEQHMSLHYFGEILYEVKGIDAFPLCKDWYGFGCYHGFLLNAIGTEGYEVVPSLDDACWQTYERGADTETCQHGIGHGLLEFSGRDPRDAIKACGLVHDIFPKLGCASGVFMEYFSPMQSSELETNVRLVPTFDEANPFDVCTQFTGTHLATCLFEIQGWWVGSEVPPTTVEALCNSVEDKEAREFCLIGYGNTVGPFVADALPYCDAFTQPESHALCRAGVLWAAEHHNDSPDPERACSDLSNEYQTLCYEKGRFTCGLDTHCTRP